MSGGVRDGGRCESCGTIWPLHLLDCKPRALRRRWWSRFVPSWLAMRLLVRAADRGVDFDWFECPCCYGPGYERGYE